MDTGDEDPDWLLVAQRMHATRGWQPVYWASSQARGTAYHRGVMASFPDVMYVNLYETNRGVWPPELTAFAPHALDEPLLRRLAPVQSGVLRMLDRMDYDRDSFPFDERVQLFYSMVGRWLSIIDRLAPDVIVFSMAPHVAGDYLLYELAQLKGITTIVFERIWSPTNVIPMTRFEDGFPGVDERYAELLASGAPADLSADARDHVMAMTEEREDYMATVRHYFGGLPPHLHTIPRAVKRLLIAIKTARPWTLHRVHRTNWMKIRGKPVSTMPRRWRFRWLIWKGNAAKRRLKRTSSRFTTIPDLSRSFVYVPLHFQPEMTTAPLGGVFVEQEQFIRLLAESLPAGWQVVVREHPGTFTPGNHGHIGRSFQFYESLAGIENVILAPVDFENMDLVESCKAVATVTGTTGWEALLRGIPVLLFGYGWYRGCEGAYDVRTKEDVVAAFEAIEATPRVDLEKIRLFIQAQEELSFSAYTNPIFANRAPDRSIEENATAIVAALKATVGIDVRTLPERSVSAMAQPGATETRSDAK